VRKDYVVVREVQSEGLRASRFLSCVFWYSWANQGPDIWAVLVVVVGLLSFLCYGLMGCFVKDYIYTLGLIEGLCWH
jgi:hypothetical protein